MRNFCYKKDSSDNGWTQLPFIAAAEGALLIEEDRRSDSVSALFSNRNLTDWQGHAEPLPEFFSVCVYSFNYPRANKLDLPHHWHEAGRVGGDAFHLGGITEYDAHPVVIGFWIGLDNCQLSAA